MIQGRYYLIYQSPEDELCMGEKCLFFVQCTMKMGQVLWLKKTFYRGCDFEVVEVNRQRPEGLCPSDYVFELTDEEYLFHLGAEKIQEAI